MSRRGTPSAPIPDSDWSELDHSLVNSWRLDTLAVQAEPLRPPQVSASKSDYGRWVLWVGTRQPMGEPHGVPIDSVSLHIQWLDPCLPRVPLNKNVQDVLVRYRRFLVDTLVPPGEREVLAFDAPGPLAEAVETLLEGGEAGPRCPVWPDVAPAQASSSTAPRLA